MSQVLQAPSGVRCSGRCHTDQAYIAAHRSSTVNDPNTWSWNELMSSDVAAAKAFYSAVFGWTYEDQDMGDAGTYTVIAGGDNGGLGGIMSRMPDMPVEVPDNWSVYFTVQDAAAVAAMVGELGGHAAVPPFPS